MEEDDSNTRPAPRYHAGVGRGLSDSQDEMKGVENVAHTKAQRLQEAADPIKSNEAVGIVQCDTLLLIEDRGPSHVDLQAGDIDVPHP